MGLLCNVWCLMPLAAKYSWISYNEKVGPLSDTMFFNIQYKINIRSSANMIFLAEVLLINSASEDFACWSIITNIYWPFENRPKKSRIMVCNVSEGVGYNINLCRSWDGVMDFQGVHKSNNFLVILSMFGKNTLDLSSGLLFSFLVKLDHRCHSLLGNLQYLKKLSFHQCLFPFVN